MIQVLSHQHSVLKENLPFFQIEEFANITWLHHAFLTRQGGVSLPPFDTLNISPLNGEDENASRNRGLVAGAFSFEPSRLVLLGQVHQDRILLLPEFVDPFPEFRGYDAAITASPNTYLGILTADCVPILIADGRRRVVAAVHAGRQGTALAIISKVLREMKMRFHCSYDDLRIAMGPSIGPCCYEIDEKIFRPEWEPFSTARGNGKRLLDLPALNISQMIRAGIDEHQIFRVGLCTRCNQDLFFSYRGSARTGRQLSFIGMT
jgi:polyphenol oxidase